MFRGGSPVWGNVSVVTRLHRGIAGPARYAEGMVRPIAASALALLLVACAHTSGTKPPPQGWANNAPTVVDRVVDRPDAQLLLVRQGDLTAWVKVPRVDAKAGDYVLLGQGTPRENVEIPEIGERVPQIVDIAHARVVDFETAKRTVAARAPAGAVRVGTVYAELEARADQKIVVYGAAAKVSGAIGWYWVHLQDGSGDPAKGTHDLTVKTKQVVAEGQRVAFRGTLRKDVDLGFGYHYVALVEDGELVVDE